MVVTFISTVGAGRFYASLKSLQDDQKTTGLKHGHGEREKTASKSVIV